ncbi:MAG: mandelate racemase/muconate lactonizing enzyme family protein [Halolamina sp.]
MTSASRLQRFSLDLEQPLTTGDGEIASREGFLVGVDRGDSRTTRGVGEATPLPGWTESLAECEAALRNPPDSWISGGVDAEGPLERPPETPAARHGYRLARFDAAGRAENRSLAALLADRVGFSEPAESVPVNATVGDGSVDETAAAARAAVDAGFACLKLKVGARSLSADIERVRAVRDSVDATLRVDANGAWTGETAREAVDAFESLDVTYIEQPVPADELAELGALRGRGVAIAADETVGLHGVNPVLDAEAADVAVLKPMVLGGPDVAVAAAKRLRENGVEPVITTTIDGAVARAAAVHAAAAVPDIRACGLATGELLAADFGSDPVPVEAGRITVPDGPGNVGEVFDGGLWD